MYLFHIPLSSTFSVTFNDKSNIEEWKQDVRVLSGLRHTDFQDASNCDWQNNNNNNNNAHTQ